MGNDDAAHTTNDCIARGISLNIHLLFIDGMMCKVTIAIAVYNLEDYIESSLLSVLDQDFEDFEILVCDDCSTDRSLEIVDSIVKSHKKGTKVKVLSTGHNSGTATSRNLAIDNARGEYLMFLDGDDLLAPHTISTFYNTMIETGVDLVVGDILWLWDGESIDEKLAKGEHSKYKPGILKSEYAIAEWLKHNQTEFFLAGLVNKLFKTCFLRENNIRCKPEHHVVEDQFFSFLLQFRVRSICTISHVGYIYRQRGNSAVHIDISKQRMNLYLKVFDDIVNGFKEIKRLHPDTLFPSQLYYVLTSRYLYGFVTLNVLDSRQLKISEKKEYLRRISTIQEIGLKKEDMVSRANRIVYQILVNHPGAFWRLKTAMMAINVFNYVRSLKS